MIQSSGLFELSLWKHVDSLIHNIQNIESWIEGVRISELLCEEVSIGKDNRRWAYFLDSLDLIYKIIRDCPIDDLLSTDNDGTTVVLTKNDLDYREVRIGYTSADNSLRIVDSFFEVNSSIHCIIENCLCFIASQSRSRQDVVKEAEALSIHRESLIVIRNQLEALPQTKFQLCKEGEQAICKILEHHKNTPGNLEDAFYSFDSSANNNEQKSKAQELRLIVSQNPPQITLNGVTIIVTPEGARLVQIAIEQQGEYFNPVNYEIQKASRVKESMPLAIRELFESKPGSGTRIPYSTLKELGCVSQK